MTQEAAQDFSALFHQLLLLREKLSPGYLSRLGSGVTFEDIRDTIGRQLGGTEHIPQMIFEIYTQVAGFEEREGEDHRTANLYWDFIPGFTLIAIADLPEALDSFNECYRTEDYPRMATFRDPFVPFLRDMSGGYVTVCQNAEASREEIYSFDHEVWWSPCMWHLDKVDFAKTHIELFSQGIYFLGDDGMLDSDYEAKAAIVAKMNPEVDLAAPCDTCEGTGHCYCIRKGSGLSSDCPRCQGTGRCRHCNGTGESN